MSQRRQRGFERCGAIPTRTIGLPAARARELALGSAWNRVAGEALARKSLRLRLARGTLEIDMVDRSWASAVHELAEEIGRRMREESTLRRVRKLRLVVDDVTVFESTISAQLAAAEDRAATVEPVAVPRRAPRRAARPRARCPEELHLRLQRAAERLLARRDQKP